MQFEHEYGPPCPGTCRARLAPKRWLIAWIRSGFCTAPRCARWRVGCNVRRVTEEGPLKTFTSHAFLSAAASAVASSLIGCGAPPTEALGEGASDLTIATGALRSGPIINFGYSVSSLPFSPVGISDYGAIVGNANGVAVASVNGGPVTPLPLPPGLGPNYQVDAISQAGVTVGDANGVGIIWQVNPACPSPGACVPPVRIVTPGNVAIVPKAVNNSSVVVGSFGDHAFRWTPQGGFEDITPPGGYEASAEGINENGSIVGYTFGRSYYAVRWSPGTPAVATFLDTGRAERIRDNGDAVGSKEVWPGDFTRLWTLTGKSFWLAGPVVAHIDGFAETGRLTGHTTGPSTDPQQAPWTFYQGTTTMLAWTPQPGVNQVSHLAVNTCGTIVGTQSFVGGERGLMWTKASCDPPGSTLPILPLLTVSVSGVGTVTSQPDGILCGSTGSACSDQFRQGEFVTLTADGGGTLGKGALWGFDHWNGACAGQANPCTLTMNASKTTSPVFVKETE